MRSIVGEDGKPLNPNSIESLLAAANDLLSCSVLVESERSSRDYQDFMRLVELRKSCGIETTIRIRKPARYLNFAGPALQED